jgi:hypothetical protein
MPSISQIRSTLTAFTKFPPIALVSIKACVLIFNLPIIHVTMKGVSRSKLKLEVEVAIHAVITPLRTSCLKVTLFLKWVRYPCSLHGLEIAL